MTQAQSKSEKAMQAEWDAETLAQAEAIKIDNGRMKRAANAAQKLAAEKERQATGMRKVAGKKAATKKAPTRKPAATKVTPRKTPSRKR